MNGIVLLDEEQHRVLLSSSQCNAASQQPRDRQLSNQGLSREYSLDLGLPRTDFTTQRRVPRTDYTVADPPLRYDFRSSGESNAHGKSSTTKRGLGDTRRTSMTMAMSSDDMGRETARDMEIEPEMEMDEEEDPDSDRTVNTFPMLHRLPSRASSTSDSQAPTQDAGEYAGTSSGLKLSVGWNMVGLMVGLVLGIFLSQTDVDGTTARWVSLPGDLFLRALKCLVVPYVFCSVAVAVGDIVFVGKISIIGVQTAKIYALFWVCTAAMGVAVALVFRPLFRLLNHPERLASNAVGFTCEDKLLLTMAANGSVACSTNATALTNATAFVFNDISDVFSKNTRDAVAKLTLSDQIMQTIEPIVSSNIVASLAASDLLAIITFSMLLGSIAGRSYFTKTRHVNYLYLSLLQLRNTFFLLMEWIIWLSPIAVVSIIAGSFASNQNLLATFGDVYLYLMAAVAGALLQVLVVYPLIVFLLTRTNPYTHMKNMVRAYMFAFACSSSLATMPVTLSCIKGARMCSQSLANFVISIGVVSSTSGMGFYLPIAIVFIAESSGNGDKITILPIVGMFVLSILTCAGTPPIPASGLVVIATAYTTLFGEIPATTFAYVAAMDFFFDRVTTVCNVNDDLMALRIISETTDETVAQNHLGQRF